MLRPDEQSVKKELINQLGEHPEGLTITDLSKLLKLNRATVRTYALVLVASNILHRRRSGSSTLYYLKSLFKKFRKSFEV